MKSSCLHPRLRKDKTCYACGKPVDISQKRNKYGNKPVVIDGHTFPSGREGKRYLLLKARQTAGEIFKLELQPWFDLEANGILVCRYRADFRYKVTVTNNGAFATYRNVVEDSKGKRTEGYIIKKKLMWACLGIEVMEV